MLSWNPLSSIAAEAAKTRIFGLTLLRTVAVLMVLYGHCVLLFPEPDQAALFRFFFLSPSTLFFVISGFLVGQILLKTLEYERVNFGTLFRFWLRRWMRTVPAYLVTLALLVFLYKQTDVKFVLRYVLFVQNFNSPHPSWFPEVWSLSIEEWFYFLVPLIFFVAIGVFKVSLRRTILICCFILIVLIPLYRFYKYETTPFVGRAAWDQLFRKQVLTRLDSIMYGVLGAYIYRFKPSIWSFNKMGYLLLGVSLILVTWIYNQIQIDNEALYASVISFSIESFAMLLIIPFFVDIKPVMGRIGKVISWISVIAYSLYLLNMSFVSLYVCYVIPQFGLTGKLLIAFKVAVYWVVSFISALILYLMVERPFILLRDRLTKKESGSGRQKTEGASFTRKSQPEAA